LNRHYNRFWITEIIYLSLLLLIIVGYAGFTPYLKAFFNVTSNAVEWTPLHILLLKHLQLVLLSSCADFIIAFSAGVSVHLFRLEGLKALLLSTASFGTTFPTIAIMALLVPALGYGFQPVFYALALYGLLPILMNTLHGLENIDDDIITAARGIGMSPFEILRKVELPLAKNLIIAGVKTSVIINIASATVGSVVGADGLGMPIVIGIRTGDPVLILEGALPVALLSLLAERLFTRLESRQLWRNA